jgi:thioredoxin
MVELQTKNEFEDLLKSDDLVLVDFFADWCGPCRAFAPVFASFATAHPNVTCRKLDVEKLNDIAQTYKVRSIPTLMLFKKGSVAKTHVGGLDEVELTSFVDIA